MKIVRKHFLLTSGLVFLVVTAVLSTLYFTMPLYYQSVKKDEVRREFNHVEKHIEGKTLSEMKKLLQSYDQKNSRMWFSLTDNIGQLHYPLLTPSSDQVSVEVSTFIDNGTAEKEHLKNTVRDKDGNAYTLEGEYSLQPVSDASEVLLDLYPYMVFLSLLLGMLLSYIYSLISTKRIKQISKTTRKMVSLSPDVVCEVKGNDEIADLAQDVNILYESLLTNMEALRLENEKVAESERNKVEFLRMTSHELKTPIAGMMGMVDGMIYGVGDYKDREKYLKKCREILEEQSQLVQSILAISKLDMETLDDMNQIFSLKDLLEEQIPFYQTMADLKGYKLTVHLEEVRLKGNPMYFLKAMKNLLDNAFHYTRENGEIRLILTKKECCIENEAERVLTKEQLSKIFQPFYRPDYSRNRKDGGTGLGLFIVQQIFDKHQLTYHFNAKDEKWMSFRIFL
ncbi:HAMP domain-containing sensor histidine kinase [Streptococcus pneumoniae]